MCTLPRVDVHVQTNHKKQTNDEEGTLQCFAESDVDADINRLMLLLQLGFELYDLVRPWIRRELHLVFFLYLPVLRE